MTEPVVMIEPMGCAGICHYTYNLCQALAARGAKVALITSRHYELEELPRRFRLYPMLWESYRPTPPSASPDPPPRRSLAQAFVHRLRPAWTMVRIVRTVLKERARVVHLQWPIGPHDWIYLAVLRRLGRRIVYTGHNVLPHEPKPEDLSRLRRLVRQTDRVIFHSEENRAAFRGLFGDAAPAACVVPHGNYFLFSEIGDGSAQEARTAIGVPSHARVVLFFGTIRPYKGLKNLIGAFRRIRDDVPDAWLVIAGYPFEPFKPYEDAIAAANLGGRTVLHLGYHAISEVAKFFLAADVVALPYRSASQSGVAQLAFAFGKPVVATRVGGLPETIDDERTGLLVDPQDEESLAKALMRLLADPAFRQSMGARAAEVAVSRYSWDRVAEATWDIYAAAGAREELECGF